MLLFCVSHVCTANRLPPEFVSTPSAPLLQAPTSNTAACADPLLPRAVLCRACAALQAHQAYKADVVAFLKSLPAAAVAKLLRLPEPSRLPARCPAPTPEAKAQETTINKPCSAAGSTDRAKNLQVYSLATQYRLSIEDAVAKSGLAEYGRGGLISQLGQLCIGALVPMDWELTSAATAAAAAEVDDEQLPLLAPPRQQQQCADRAAKDGSVQPMSAAAASAAEFAAACSGCCTGASSNGCGCSCACHADIAELAELLPPTDVIVDLLEQASEGTWLCNPRLLQQPHSSSTAAPTQGRSPDAVMGSISGGWDVMDVLAEHGVDDASLSYAVERRIITAYHKVGKLCLRPEQPENLCWEQLHACLPLHHPHCCPVLLLNSGGALLQP
jgi:hypothetical protein